MPRKKKLLPLHEDVKRYVREMRTARDKARNLLETGLVNPKLKKTLRAARVPHALVDDLHSLTYDQITLFIEIVNEEFENLVDHLDKLFDLGKFDPYSD